jgi:hypothetical protein
MTVVVRVFLAVLLLPAFIVVARSVSSSARAVRVTLLLVAMLISLATLINPRLWTVVATRLGLNSGLELIIYTLGLGLFLHVAYSLGRIRRLDDRVVALTREIALLQGVKESELYDQGRYGSSDEPTNS